MNESRDVLFMSSTSKGSLKRITVEAFLKIAPIAGILHLIVSETAFGA